MRTKPTEGGIGFLLNHASRAVLARLGEQLRELGLDEEMWIMMRNMRRPGIASVDPVEAAARLRMPPRVTEAAIERLVRDGWAVARPQGRGAPATYELTQKGVDVMPGLEDTAAWLIEHATSGFTNAELDVLAGYLRRIIDNMA